MTEENELAKLMRADIGDAGMKRVVTKADLYDLVGQTMDVILGEPMEFVLGEIKKLMTRIDALESTKQGDSK